MNILGARPLPAIVNGVAANLNSGDSPDGTDPLRDEDFFRKLADGAPVLIWMAGLDMGCFYFNRAWLDFRGRTLEQEQGNGWAEGVHPDDVERCVHHYVDCFEQRAPFAMSYRLKNRAGDFRWILDRGAPHFQPDGTFLGFYGGCAETEGDRAIERIQQLRTSLSQMGDFAQQRASAKLTLEDGVKIAEGKRSLESFARGQTNAERMQRKLHATAEFGRLAEDMIRYGKIENGACLVDGPQKR